MVAYKIMKNDHTSYVRDLETHVKRYLSILESIFGPRDSRFMFGTIQRSNDDRPQIHFPNGFHFRGDCRVNILISSYPWEHRSPDQGPWQVAHECAHLLDPTTMGFSNILEEGLATWFQNSPCYHEDKHVRCYITKIKEHSPAYAEAQKLVRDSLPDILHAVKSLRDSGVRICDIKTDILAPLLPRTERKKVERLCARFQN